MGVVRRFFSSPLAPAISSHLLLQKPQVSSYPVIYAVYRDVRKKCNVSGDVCIVYDSISARDVSLPSFSVIKIKNRSENGFVM